MTSAGSSSEYVYAGVMTQIFQNHYSAGDKEVRFDRHEISDAAESLGLPVPRNLGDVPYHFRYRHKFPSDIADTAPKGKEWILEGAGRSKYCLRLVSASRVVPNPSLVPVKIPDSTPEIISMYAMSDEQALLAKVRYNRLVDLFLSVTAYSLQNHLRTTVKGIGQIEIDEVYVAVNTNGAHFIVPVQAKGGSDQIGVVQASQDLAFCRQQYPHLVARPLAAQFMADDVIALFELALSGDEVGMRREQHYRLVSGSDIDEDDLSAYITTSGLDAS